VQRWFFFVPSSGTRGFVMLIAQPLGCWEMKVVRALFCGQLKRSSINGNFNSIIYHLREVNGVGMHTRMLPK